ncbi:MAG: hypothetical protein ACRDOD_20205, partial [Streptosporangiaceae bacterium]
MIEALWDAVRGVGSRHGPTVGRALQLACADHGVVLVRTGAGDDAAEEAVSAVASALRRRVADNPGARVIAAVGDPQARLVDAHLSYRQ